MVVEVVVSELAARWEAISILTFQRLDARSIVTFILSNGRVQIGRDDREGALNVVDHVPAACVDVANLHAPMSSLGWSNKLPPETQNEDLIRGRKLLFHRYTMARRELVVLPRSSRIGDLWIINGCFNRSRTGPARITG